LDPELDPDPEPDLLLRGNVRDPWHFGSDLDPGSPDPYLMDLATDPDPTPNQTPFFIDFILRMPNKIFVFIFFSYNLPTGTSSSV
jgi:hypothetical protein